MTGYVEMLNHWGDEFWGFAWPMLWQSSLLIAVVFAFDALFAWRIRASVRYALWMVVLVKLILPPALALPTSATWWLWRPHPAVLPPVIQNYTVSYGDSVSEDTAVSAIPVLPPPKLSWEAGVLLAATATAMAFLSWLAFRWLRVAGKVRRAAIAPAELDGILEEARKLARLRGRPQLKLIDDAQSPAVYGLFRPVILLPRMLINRISGRQLRAVLLHEAMHLRRGDVWMNFVQTLLQIAYWWHPLLWLANARIRRVREEAVDDAVMLTLRDGADAYAPTLLEVAKFAFRRPLASLGLVGILESRSALRQRVERLVDFRPPRKAGVTFLSLCGIFAFCAVALPMGQGPAADLSSSVVSTNPGNATDQLDLIRKSQALYRKLNGIHIDVSYTNAPLDDVLLDLSEKAREKDPDTQGVNFIFQPNADRAEPIGSISVPSNIRLTLTLNSASLASISEAICNHSDQHLNYMVTDKGVVFSDGPYCEIRSFKLGTNVFFANLRELAAAPISTSETNVNAFLTELIEGAGVDLFPPKWVFFSQHLGGVLTVNATPGDIDVIEHIAEILHEAGGGKNLWLKSINHPTYLNRSVLNGTSAAIDHQLNQIQLNVSYNEPLSKVLGDLSRRTRKLDTNKLGINFLFNPARIPMVDASGIKINLALNNATLREVLNAICLVSDHPITYSIQDYGVVFSNQDINSPQYEMRVFKVDTNTFYSNLKNKVAYNGPPNEFPQHVSALAIEFFSRLGVNLDPPKSIYYKDREALLFVYATPQDLDVVDKAMRVLSGDPRSGDSSRTQSSVSVSVVAANFKDVVPDPATDAKTPGPQVSSSVTATDLEQRVFFVGYPAFCTNVLMETGETDPLEGFKKMVATAGVDLSPPKAVFLSHNTGALSVYASKSDLETIQSIVVDLHCPPAMIHIKARFLEVPQKFFSTVVANSSFPGLTNGGVLPNPEFRAFLREAESQHGSEELAEPEVTTIVGRQIKMRATVLQPVVTNYIAKPNPNVADGLTISPQIAQVETGPVFNVVPFTLFGGTSIVLNASAELTEFFGYASPQGLPISYATNSAGEKVPLATSLPAIQLIRAQGYKTIYDGQTLVLLPEPVQMLLAGSNKKRQEIIARDIQDCEKNPKVEYGDKVIVAFVTATLIDPAGNRLHSDREMSFAQTSVPPQSP